MIFGRIEMWVYSISPPRLSLIGALITEIIIFSEKKTGNTNTHNIYIYSSLNQPCTDKYTIKKKEVIGLKNIMKKK